MSSILASTNCEASGQKKRLNKPKKSELELIKTFWEAPPEAFFSQETVSPVAKCSIKTLACDRWRGKGIPFRKVSGRVLYRKSDVVAFLENHELVNSTSHYKKENIICQK